MARLFVAAWPPADVIEALAALPRPRREGVRWTTEDQWHVTLRFLGEASPEVAAAALADVEAPRAAVELGPHVHRFGRGYLAVMARGLDDLAAAVVRATAHVGRPPENRPFRGHVTLARLREWAKVAGLTDTAFSARFELGEIALVQSQTHPDGSRYHTVATVPLQ